MAIVLVGDPEQGIKEIAAHLTEAGMRVHSEGEIIDDSALFLCVSWQQGVTEETWRRLDAWKGHRGTPLGVIVTDTDENPGGDLTELVYYEGRYLFALATSRETAEQVELLRLGDDDLVEQIQNLLGGSPPSVEISEIDYEAFESYSETLYGEVQEPPTMVAFVFLDEKKLPSPEDINKILAERWPNSPLLRSTQVKDGTTTFDFADGLGSFSLVEKRYPWEELAPRCQDAWWWEDAEKILKDHGEHAVIATAGIYENMVTRALHLSALTAAIVELTDSIAVNWPMAGILHEGREFVRRSVEVQTAEPPIPLSLWVNFQMGQTEENRYTLFTNGMEYLGFPELEVHSMELDPDYILRTSQLLALHMVGNGLIPGDGDTFGFAEGEKIPLRYSRSICDPEKTILLIDFDNQASEGASAADSDPTDAD